MITLISERHKLKFYLTVALTSLFFLALGIGSLMVYLKLLNHGALKSNNQLLPFLSIGSTFMAIYNVYRYYKNAPFIQIDNSNIKFNKQSFALREIEHLELSGKKNFPYLIGFPLEATTLIFKNGQTKYIFDDMYQNSWQIKSFLKQVVVDHNDYATQNLQEINQSDLESEHYDTYKGNQFLSLRGIGLWGFIAFITYTVLTGKKNPGTASILVYVFACVFWFIAHSSTMNYFKVSQNYLAIKNHNFLWRSKAYRLSDIKEVVFETQGKMPNCLRVITKDFRNKLYLAGTLTDKTWLKLKDKLETHNIKVRNECI